MSWLVAIGIGGAALAALALLGVTRALWAPLAAALLVAGAGYGWQGRPVLAESPARPAARDVADDPDLIAVRGAMFGRFTLADAYLVAADALARADADEAAANVLLGGLHAMPRDASLWTALGTAIAHHDADRVSPPALFAFREAGRLAPRHPAPPFFLGIAYAREGDLAAARAPWARALALTPAGAPYRDAIAERLALLDRYLAVMAPRAPTP